MANKSVKLKNKRGDYLYPYTDNIPTGSASVAGKVKVDAAPTSGSANAVSSGGVYSALAGKLGTNDTAAKATADAEGNNIASTYLKKSEEGKGGLHLLRDQLRKAYAWTWSQTSTSGTVYIVYNSNGGMLDGIACTSYATHNGPNSYVAINGNLYYYNSSASPVTLTQKTSDGGITFVGSGVVIKSGKLYSYYKNDYVDTNTGWTFTSGYFGIRNGALMAFSNQSTLLCSTLDSTGTWTDIDVPGDSASECAGIRDGYPYYVSRKGVSGGFAVSEIYQFDSTNGFTHASYANTSGYCYFTKGSSYTCWNINVYHNTGRTTPYYQGDLGEEIVKLRNQYALTSGGKLYSIGSNNPTLISDNVIDIGTWGYLKSDGLYNYTKNLLVSGTFASCNGVMLYAGAGTTQYRTVYTVSIPAVNYLSFERVNLEYPNTITAVTSASITVNSKIYNRDISKDDVFTQTPDDLRKQTPTKWELLDMISNLD